MGQEVRAVEWRGDRLRLLDQRLLPDREVYLELQTAAEVAAAITDMAVRGAPAIGITAAYGVVLAASQHRREHRRDWRQEIEQDLELLGRTRPTAVNLAWALERMRRRLRACQGEPEDWLLAEARQIHQEDIAANRHMGELGADLLGPDCAVLTHCNTGALATGGYGTALGVVRSGYRSGRIKQVYADETRPWLQGTRLTAWELAREGMPAQLIVDSAASYLMSLGRVQWVIVGADRIAANGDVANKIGTYGLAVAARHHGVRFMVVAPSSTVDMALASGTEIPIETRDGAEILALGKRRLAPAGVAAWNPVFDVTPAELINAIVTERGVVRAPDATSMRRLMAAG